MKPLTLSLAFFLIAITCSALNNSIGEGNGVSQKVCEVHGAAGFGPSDYVSDEIIVKFREEVARRVEEQVGFEKSAGGLKLSKGLDELNAKHRAKEIKLYPVSKSGTG